MIEGRPCPSDRLPCLVPGCGRTFKAGVGDSADTEIMCGKHYRLAPAALRAEYVVTRRRYRMLERRGRQCGGAAWKCQRQWRAIREAVLSAAAGNINPADLAAFVETI